MPRVKLAGVLVALAGGRDEVEVEGSTVKEVLESLSSVSQKLYRRVVGDGGRLRPDIYIAVNDVDIRLLSGLSTQVKKDDVVLILAYIHPG
ncbi:ThiS family [Pyrobaculum oguniense TE7]|uniref:ThiS family n=1 Tax=Pyrobaculum oguniense (strain DSM 13380 / JCM 10595 / TE7) TaxID=698757 RepID=H6Q644_PYROT|nr:ThiS family [Pyrobaculum oguniense TE7]